jgi:hypothetical protein
MTIGGVGCAANYWLRELTEEHTDVPLRYSVIE